MEELLLKMSGITKSFGGSHALKDVQLEVYKGEIIGLLGENGAGKSTLMNILLGMFAADSGTIWFKGRNVHYKEPAEALKDGISMIHQEISLVPTLTVAENIWLGREKKFKKGLFVDEKMRRQRTKEFLDNIGLDLNPDDRVGALSIAKMQLAEIARAITYNSKLIIMDEPTSALTNQEVDILFALIKRLSAEGTAIIFITHKMDEVFEICNKLVVLKDGKYVGTKSSKETTPQEMISLIAGREMKEMFPKEKAQIGDTILEVTGLTGKGFQNISFQLRKGEILGFCGLVGAGRTEVARVLFGLDKYDSGIIKIEGKEVRFHSCKEAIKHGLAMVTEDRLREGAIHRLNIRINATLAVFDKICGGSGFYNVKKEKRIASDEMTTMNVALQSTEQTMASLSGGNQQKVIIGRWLMTHPRILILDEPTRGIDVGSKAEIHKMISRLAQEGVAILLISSELPELMGMSDRIIVLHEGKKTYECMRGKASAEEIMLHAFGLETVEE